MVTAQTQYSLGNARSYFTEHLAVGDYYAEGQTVAGEWFGRGAERLGLSGRIRESEFLRPLTQLLADKPELAGGNLKDLRSRIATAERARKQKEMGRAQLRDLWESQTTRAERESLRQLTRSGEVGDGAKVSMADAVAWAEEHLFDRASVDPEHRIWQEALARARGGDFTTKELKAFTQTGRGYLRSPVCPAEVTLPEVLDRERRIIGLARDGIGAWHPFVSGDPALDPGLGTDQREALRQLLGSTHGISVFRGGAGTGKSFVLRQWVDRVMATGRPVVVLAPQRQQVVEMERDGFPKPTTVAQFLIQRDVPPGAAIVVDEAGQIGGRQMLDLLQLANDRGARVILSGDNQASSV